MITGSPDVSAKIVSALPNAKLCKSESDSNQCEMKLCDFVDAFQGTCTSGRGQGTIPPHTCTRKHKLMLGCYMGVIGAAVEVVTQEWSVDIEGNIEEGVGISSRIGKC